MEKTLIGRVLEIDPGSPWVTYQQDIPGLTAQSLRETIKLQDLESSKDNANDNYALPAPTIDSEATRLVNQHQLWLKTLNGRLHTCPISEKLKNVLDVGTGTGIWAIDYAMAHPEASVYAFDISAPQASIAHLNCKLFKYDAEGDWQGFVSKSGSLDFIHCRHLGVAIRDWPRLFAQAWDSLTPEGWIEISDFTFEIHSANDNYEKDSALIKGYEYMPEICKTYGVDITAYKNFKELLMNQGFANISEDNVQWAIGGWPMGEVEKRIGEQQALTFFEQPWKNMIQQMFGNVLGWDQPKVGKLIEDVQGEVMDPNRQYYLQL